MTMITITSVTLLCLLFVSLGTCQDEESPLVTQITYEINEESPNGSHIGNVAVSSKLQNTDVGFKITTQEQELLVNLNETTGDLTTNRVIDREVVCKNEIKCEKVFQVLAVKLVQPLAITLVINDINDKTPTFAKDRENMTLSESLAPGAVKPLPAAIDLDTGVNNSVKSYEFAPSSNTDDKFQLLVEKTELKLKLIDNLDRETKDQYRLLVLAKDGGVPTRTGTLTLDILVEDDNDNKPEFEHSVLNVSVTEDIAVGKTIVSLQATDKDAGKNGQIEYKLGQQQTNYIFEHFAINKTSGELSVVNQLGYEDGNSEKVIYVVATDKGDTPQSSQATVYLTIKDAGNNRPVITVTNLFDDLLISEATPVDTAIMYVIVTDSDTGVNGQVTCHIYNTYFGLQTVPNFNKNYQVFVQHSLDRESIPEHNVTIICQDGGGLESIETYTITVKDENDHTPQFNSYVYYANVTENNTYGAELLTVSAKDEDIGDNGKITYRSASPEFEVESNTGIVRAKISLDREKYNQKVFSVLAVDNNKDNPRTGTATVQLNIIDINDEKPIFTNPNPPYEFRVKEGLKSNTYVDSVTAIDTDRGENGRVEYGLVLEYRTGMAMAVPFDVLPNGEIKTTMELDRESQSAYRFQVFARDFGVPYLTSVVDVRVIVDDVNDEMPVFIFPSTENHTVTAFNEVSDTPIATLSGADSDSGINQELIYFIAEGDDNGIFSLDPNSGKLYIIKYVHLTADKQLRLLVSVYDKGDPPLSAKSELQVNLRYTNITTIEPYTDVNKSYVIIVVTVVCITCLLSITIITVICLIRRKDIVKCGNNNSGKPPSFPSRMFAKGKPQISQTLENDRIYPATSTQQKKKKEVSFSHDDTDSLSSNDFKQLYIKDNKGSFPSRQTNLNDMPEETGDQYDNQPISILRPAQPYSPENDMQMNVSHQREDSHSETSGETTTTYDSGKGCSVEGDNHDLKFDLNPLNPSAYLIHKDSYHQRQPMTSTVKHPSLDNIPPRTLPFNTSTLDTTKHTSTLDTTKNSVAFKTGFPRSHNTHSYSANHSTSKNWGHNLDSNASYPDSDYISVASNQNSHMPGYRDLNYSYSSKSANREHIPLRGSELGYANPGYPPAYTNGTYRSNSTRDDDETTTTSGSYTVNHEDLDDDFAAVSQYHMSQVV